MAKKKLFVGGLISGAIGVTSTLIGNNKQKKAEKRLARQQFANALEERKTSDEAVLDTYPTEGVNTDELYAKGGVLPKGHKKQLARDVEQVVNAGTHESGNDVDVGPAKVENDEVILDGEKVLSDRLGYADVSKHISEAKGELENVLNSKNFKRLNNRERNTAERTLVPLQRAVQKLDAANEANFQTQEANKLPISNITGEKPEAALGLDLKKVGKIGKEALPFIDNITGFLQRTPKPPKPVTQEAAKLDTTVDVSQQLQDVKDMERESELDIDLSTTSSNVALARKARMREQSRRAKAGILANKEAQEQTLENQDRLNRQRVQSQNVAAQNEYAQNVFTREVAKTDKLQANIQNIVGDIRQKSLDDAMAVRDEQAALAIMSQGAATNSDVNVALSGGMDWLSDAGKSSLYNRYKAQGLNEQSLQKLAAMWGL